MFQSVRILIVEDEFAIALDLETQLKKWGHEIVGIANSFDQAMQKISQKDPKLIILDIHLKGQKTGIDLGKHLVHSLEIPFIYLTAFGDDKTFEEARSTFPFAFLTKPFNSKGLKRSIELAINQFESNKQKLPQLSDLLEKLRNNNANSSDTIFFTKEGNKVRKINIEHIQYISAFDNYAKVHTNTEMIIVHESMSTLEKKLSSHKIIRVHRSYLVAINAIDSIEDFQVKIGSVEVPISKTYKKELMERLSWL